MGKRLISVYQRSRIFSKNELMFLEDGVYCVIKNKTYKLHCLKVFKSGNHVTVQSYINPDGSLINNQIDFLKQEVLNSYVVRGMYYEEPFSSVNADTGKEDTSVKRFEKSSPGVYDYIFALVNTDDNNDIIIPSQEMIGRSVKRKSNEWYEDAFSEAYESDYDVESFTVEIGKQEQATQDPILPEPEPEPNPEPDNTPNEKNISYFERPKYIRLTDTDEVVMLTGMYEESKEPVGFYKTGSKKDQPYEKTESYEEATDLTEEEAEYLIKNDKAE